jgi:hypothetical protein
VRAPLYRVACALPASCYLIARPDTILVTHDAGAPWAARVLPVHVPGRALPGCVIGDPTVPQGETPCRLGLLDISCPSASTCYAVATAPGGYDAKPISRTPGAGPAAPSGSLGTAGPPGPASRSHTAWYATETAANHAVTRWNGSLAHPPGRAGPAATSSPTATPGFASPAGDARPGRSWRLEPGCPASGPCSEPGYRRGRLPRRQPLLRGRRCRHDHPYHQRHPVGQRHVDREAGRSTSARASDRRRRRSG